MSNQNRDKKKYLVYFAIGQTYFAFPLHSCLEVLTPKSLFLINDKLLFSNTDETVHFDSIFGDDIKGFFLYNGQIVPIITLNKYFCVYDSAPVHYILPLNIDNYNIGIELTNIDITSYSKQNILYDDKVTSTKCLKYQIKLTNKPPIYMIDFLQLDYFTK